MDIEILKVDFRHIKDLEIISFKELPEEKQNLDFTTEIREDSRSIIMQAGSLIKTCLVNPKRWSEFGDLSVDEFYEFFTKWVKLSYVKGNDENPN